MKIVNHPATVALGAATLCLLPFFSPLISPSHLAIYHLSDQPSTIFVPVLLNFLAVWALIAFVLALAEKPGRRQVFVWSGLTLFLPWILLKSASHLIPFKLPYWLNATVLISSFLAFVALLTLWRHSAPSFHLVRRFMTIVLGFVSLSGLLMLAQFFWFEWQVRNLNSPIPLHQRQTTDAAALHARNSRIVWILFDELSYEQVYEQRFPGLSLPAFDAVASQSTVFTNVVPAGFYTENIIPSLFTGLSVDRIRASSDGKKLSLHNPASGTWQDFDARQTLFQDALTAGYSTAVVGWYNPYCRILPQVLDHCFWASQILYPGAIVPGWSIRENTMQPLLRRIEAATTFRHNGADPDSALQAQIHIADYSALRDAADTVLADPSADFVFLHMPIPHPGGIYNRESKALTTARSSYVDNLALADEYLAHVSSLLKERGEWDSSTIVIMGDHSWRTNMWSPTTTWTPEDSSASHGAQFDDRPAYLIKLPYQKESARMDEPYAAIRTRSLFAALTTKRIHSQVDLSDWVRQQRGAQDGSLAR